ncbi:hypothetical protein HYH03_015736 [Edaphochlamys debaryana]|uniref:Uncharacterized protein n=1 Tax=Edaphochlamys debaryana TaxID=47281 RepID=A0A835XMN2_9CHLO|nr:hypothetical protein HYH03_015736 [Edaphochlamys debaryana]|eukprot:KAG2485573.1 hypothetical protein HYH03_015736 [Edaphochlamys debaryana]
MQASVASPALRRPLRGATLRLRPRSASRTAVPASVSKRQSQQKLAKAEEFNKEAEEFNKKAEEFNKEAEEFYKEAAEATKEAEEFNKEAEEFNKEAEEFNKEAEEFNKEAKQQRIEVYQDIASSVIWGVACCACVAQADKLSLSSSLGTATAIVAAKYVARLLQRVMPFLLDFVTGRLN